MARICQSCNNCKEDCGCPPIGFSVSATYGPCTDGIRRITGVFFAWSFERIGDSVRRPITLPMGVSFEFWAELDPGSEAGVLVATFFPPDTDSPRQPEPGDASPPPDAAFDPEDGGPISCLPRFFVIVRDEDGNFLFKCWVCPIDCDELCGSSDSSGSGSGDGGSSGSGSGSGSGGSGSDGDGSGSGSGSGSGGGDGPPDPPDPPSSDSSGSGSSGTTSNCVCTVILSAVAFRFDNESPTTCLVTFEASVAYSADCDFSAEPAQGLWSYSIGTVTGNGNGANEVPVDCLPDGTIMVTSTFTPTGGAPVAPSVPCSSSVAILSILVP